MKFTEVNIKYCLLAFSSWESPHSDEYAKQNIPLSGLFNWSVAFGGKRFFPRSVADTEQFNVVHVNITANNLLLIPSLLKIIDRSKTKLLFNVDYALEMWYPHFKFPPLFIEMLDKADYIFSVEEEMAETLSLILKRRVACIPHPCDVSKIKSLTTTERWPVIGAMLHSYDSNQLLPALSINSVLDSRRPAWRSTALGGVAADKEVGHLYDNFLPHNPNFSEFITYLSQLYAMVESYMIHSYGRTTIECAALGVPVIGSSVVSSQRRCFPDLCTETAQVKKTAEYLEQLIVDSTFWSSCAHKAVEQSEYYSFKNCKSMMLEFLNSGD
jgi:hypothetical protein